MELTLHSTQLEGLCLIENKMSEDICGSETPLFNAPTYAAHGLQTRFVSENLKQLEPQSLQGIYYQKSGRMAQMVTLLSGAISMIGVDLRRGTKTCGQWVRIDLLEHQNCQVNVGPGLGFGLATDNESASLLIRQTELYDERDFGGVLWSDEDLEIEWPISDPVVNPRDSYFRPLRQIHEAALPEHKSIIRAQV